MFETKGQKAVEIVSELLMLWTCMFLAQFLVQHYNAEQIEIIEQCTLTFFALLVTVNVSYVIFNLCVNCKEKKRVKRLAKKKLDYKQAIKDREQEKKDDKRRSKIL